MPASFRKKRSSNQILQLLAAFLNERSMTIRLKGISSTPLPINAGAPQGSVLGCYLFNEEDFNEDTDQDRQRDAYQETYPRRDDYPAASTSQRVGLRSELMESPIAARHEADFTILPRVANVPHRIPKPKDPLFHTGSIKTYKYVDDEVNTNKVNMRKARLLVENGTFFKEVVDICSQRLLSHIAERANQRGMAINAGKTGLMLVSAISSFEARVRLEVADQTVTGKDSMKLLGVTLDKDTSFSTHVEKLAARLRSKT